MQNNQYPYSAHFPDQARKNSKPSFWKRLMGEFDPTPQAPPPQAAPYTPYPIGQASGGQQSNGQDQAAEEARQRELKEKEEEELQLALALSLSEEEAKKGRQTGLYHQFGTNPTSTSAPIKTNEPKRVNGSSSATPSDMYIYRGVAQENTQRNGDDEEDIDPALSRYLDKRYWEQRQAARDAETTATMNQANDMMNVRATAPPASEYSFSTSSGDPNVNDFGYMAYNNGTQQQQPSASNGIANGYEFNTAPIEKKMSNMTIESKAAESNDEIDQTLAFCKNLREQVEIMDNRMRSNLMRGRSVVNDSAIHSLFKQLTSRHADVLNRMGKLDSDREFFEGLQDHLAYIQEARQALESLREENLKQRQERLQEEQRLRMQQMQAKLEQIRHKKYEALCEQRLMALQRLQDEENRIQQGRNAAQQPGVPIQQQNPEMSTQQQYVAPEHSAAQFHHPQQYSQPQQQFAQSQSAFYPPQQHGHQQFQNQPYVHPQNQQAYPAPQQQFQSVVYPPQQQQVQTPVVQPDDEPLIKFD